MKNILKSIAILGIISSIILGLYGSVKFARANGDEPMEETKYLAQKKAANRAFTAAAFLFVGGIALLIVGGKSK